MSLDSNITDSDLERLNDLYITFSNSMAEEFPIAAIAGVMLMQALTFYRTMLTDEDYDYYVKRVYETRMSVKPYRVFDKNKLN